MSSPAPVFDLDDMQFSPTAWLFEGAKRGGAGVSMFIVRTPPGGGSRIDQVLFIQKIQISGDPYGPWRIVWGVSPV